jgi:hypothetical protein
MSSLRTGNIALGELGRLSAEAGEAQRRGTLSTAGRRAIDSAIDSGVKNSAVVIDPAASVPRNTALAAARPGGVVQRTLGATLRPQALEDGSGGVAESVSHEARARNVAPVTVSTAQASVSIAARAIDNAPRPTAARSPNADVENAQRNAFDFHDPTVAQQFVHALTGRTKVTAGQRTALIDSVLQNGAMSLGELRAFQIALDDAARLGLVTREESQQAWRTVASEAARHVGGSTIAARAQGEEIARHGLQRFRG